MLCRRRASHPLDLPEACSVNGIGNNIGVWMLDGRAQRCEMLSSNGEAGSIPARTTKGSSMVERTTEDRDVAGSSPAPTERLRSRFRKAGCGSDSAINRLTAERFRSVDCALKHSARSRMRVAPLAPNERPCSRVDTGVPRRRYLCLEPGDRSSEQG